MAVRSTKRMPCGCWVTSGSAQIELIARRAAAHALILMPRDLVAVEAVNQLTAAWPKLVETAQDSGLPRRSSRFIASGS